MSNEAHQPPPDHWQLWDAWPRRTSGARNEIPRLDDTKPRHEGMTTLRGNVDPLFVGVNIIPAPLVIQEPIYGVHEPLGGAIDAGDSPIAKHALGIGRSLMTEWVTGRGFRGRCGGARRQAPREGPQDPAESPRAPI